LYQKSQANRKKILATLCLINLFANSAYSSIGPFFPLQSLEKGVPQKYLGLIIAGYSISMLVFSPVYGSLLSRFGRRNILVLGCVSEGLAMLLFSCLAFIDNPKIYASAAFSFRFLEGFGNGCLNSATSSIISFYFKDNTSNLIGLTQTFTGLGMLCGPLIGAILFEAGGFVLPFLTVGTLLLTLVIPTYCYIINDNRESTRAERS
jgi:MFS family permease